MHRRNKPAVVTLLALCAVHCDGVGTETDNPASTTFRGTNCTTNPYEARKDPVATTGDMPSTQSLQSLHPLGTMPPMLPAEDYDGLTCLSYSHSDNGDLHVDLWNYSAPCGAKFVDGTAKLAGTRLDLLPVDRQCFAGKCTQACFYDLHFVIPSVPDDMDLGTYYGEVNEAFEACFGPPDFLATLPLSTQSSGTMCRPLGRVTPPKNCAKHGPCDSALGCSCPEGFTCGQLTADVHTVCLVPCSTDAECPNSAMKCENGSCVLGATF